MATLRERFGGYRCLRRQWATVSNKATLWLMPLELIGLIPALVIFALAQPDLYRTSMWAIGYQNQLNSNPNMIIYAYANYKPLPKVPLVWSETLTDFNVAISVISLFFLLAKLIAFIMDFWYPAFALFINVSLVALYSASTYGQIGPDYADSRYPAPAAWYFRQGCGLAKKYGKYGQCQMAQASLGITLYLLVIYLVNVGFCAWAMKPNSLNDTDGDEDDDEGWSQSSDLKTDKVELQGMKSVGDAGVTVQPFTPRTQAFHKLDRQAPRNTRRYA